MSGPTDQEIGTLAKALAADTTFGDRDPGGLMWEIFDQEVRAAIQRPAAGRWELCSFLLKMREGAFRPAFGGALSVLDEMLTHQPSKDALRPVLGGLQATPPSVRDLASDVALPTPPGIPERFTPRRELRPGRTLLVEDAVLGRLVVLKMLPIGANAAARERFKEQTRSTASQLGIAVQVHDLCEAPRMYAVLQYLPQGDVATRAKRSPDYAGVARLLHATALGLFALHQQRRVHLNLRPGNILVEGDGGLEVSVRFADFAALPVMGNIDAYRAPLEPDVYTAPEHQAGGTVDGRTDLYSIGKVFAEVLEEVGARLGPPPDALASIVHQCARTDPTERPASAGMVCDHVLAERLSRASPSP